MKKPIELNIEDVVVFDNFQQWVNKAQSWLKHDKYSVKLLCVD